MSLVIPRIRMHRNETHLRTKSSILKSQHPIFYYSERPAIVADGHWWIKYTYKLVQIQMKIYHYTGWHWDLWINRHFRFSLKKCHLTFKNDISWPNDKEHELNSALHGHRRMSILCSQKTQFGWIVVKTRLNNIKYKSRTCNAVDLLTCPCPSILSSKVSLCHTHWIRPRILPTYTQLAFQHNIIEMKCKRHLVPC